MYIEKKNRWLLLIITLYFILAIKYAFTYPIFEAPDENHHFDYIKFLIKYHRIPIRGENTPGVPYVAVHPPLFYFLNALIYRPLQSLDSSINVLPNENFGLISKNKFFHKEEKFNEHIPFYLLRLFSIFLSIGTIFFTWKIAEEIFPENYYFAAISTSITAFIPQFIFISSSVNNDNLVNLIGTIVLWLIIKTLKEDFSTKKTIISLGIFLGLAVITKFTIFFLIPLTFVCLFVWDKDKIRFVKNMAIIFLLIGIVGGWYYVRNLLVYGDSLGDPFLNKRGLFSSYFIRPFATVTTISFFGVFGWMNIVMDRFVYYFYIFLSSMGFLGMLMYFSKRQFFKDNKGKYYLILILSCFFSLAAVIRYNMNCDAYQGRYLFNIISSFAILVTGGYYYLYIWLKAIWPREFVISEKNKNLITLLLILILTTLNIYILNIYIKPSYAGAFI